MIDERERLEKSYESVGRFSSLIRNYSIFATATFVGQLAKMTYASFYQGGGEWIAFVIGMGIGLYIGYVLEDYYESAVVELEQYEGKEYQQNTLKRHQENTKWGFRTALAFNVLTFTAGTYAIIATAFQVVDYKDLNKVEQLKVVQSDVNRIESRLNDLYDQMKVDNVNAYYASILADRKSKIEKANKEIEDLYKPKLKEALKEFETRKKEIEAWASIERKKKSNMRDGFKTLNKKRKEMLSKARAKLDAIKAELKSRLKDVRVVSLSLAEAREKYVASLEEKASKYEAKLKEKRAEASRIAEQINGGDNGNFLLFSFASILLASIYYFFQNRNYKYRATLAKKIIDLDKKEGLVLVDGFDLSEFEIEEEEGKSKAL